MTLRDASELLWPAVQETLATLGLLGEDSAAKKLAQRYAQIIDQSDYQEQSLRQLGPLLLKALDALGATPEARARISRTAKPGGDANAAPTRLDQLRQSRASRRTP